MATTSLALAGSLSRDAGTMEAALADWRAYHLHYHGDLDMLLDELVRPLVARLLADGAIDSFFFVRYGLGGPHVRLRLRWAGEPDAAAVERAAAGFFRRRPSRDSLTPEEVMRRNRPFLAVDPMADASEDRVVPDNSCHEEEPVFELDRYGGGERFAPSLDLFALSSLCVLRWLRDGGGALGAGARLNRALGLVVAMAWGFAAGRDDFRQLVDYASRFMGDPLAHCADEADRAYERQGETLVELMRRALAVDRVPTHPRALLAEGARRLAPELAGLPADDRWYVAASHIHMTLNRLGLLNPEEVYASRLLWHAVGELERRHPACWDDAFGRRAPQRDGETVGGLLPPLLSQLAVAAGEPR